MPALVTKGDSAKVLKVPSLLQIVRGGSSSPSRTQIRKWYVVPGSRPYTGSDTGCGSSPAIATTRSGVLVPYDAVSPRSNHQVVSPSRLE